MGGAAMFLLQVWISVLAYPLNIAGRPTYSWPAFIVPAYEWTILWAGLSAAFGMLALNGLPALYHPLFNAPNFRDGATTDKFFLCLEALDPKFDLRRNQEAYLEGLQAASRWWRWTTDGLRREQVNKRTRDPGSVISGQWSVVSRSGGVLCPRGAFRSV